MSERRTGYGFFAAVMAVCLVLSMAGNGLHVWSQWQMDTASGVDRGSVGPWVPTLSIMLAPAMVMVMTEMLIVTHRANASRVRSIVTVLAAVVGVIALAVSYSGLVYVCETIIALPTVLAYAAPLIVDLPIIAATIGLWDVLEQRRAALVRSVESSEQLSDEAVRPTPVRASEPSGRPVDRTDEHWSIDAVDQVVEHAARPVVEVDGEPIDRPVRTLDDQPDEHWSTGSDLAVRVDGLMSDQAVVQASDVLSELDDQPVELSGRPVGRPIDGVDDEVSEPIDRPDEHPVELASDHVDERSADPPTDWRVVAERVRSDTGLTADVGDLAQVLEMAEAGASRREIAEAVGRAKSTVSGWITKAGDVQRLELASVD